MLKEHSGTELLFCLGWWWNKYVLVKEHWEEVTKIASPSGLWCSLWESFTLRWNQHAAPWICRNNFEYSIWSFFFSFSFFACTLKRAQFQNVTIRQIPVTYCNMWHRGILYLLHCYCDKIPWPKAVMGRKEFIIIPYHSLSLREVNTGIWKKVCLLSIQHYSEPRN